MKRLTTYLKDNKSSLISLKEKLIIFPSQVNEKLAINKDFNKKNRINKTEFKTEFPKDYDELKRS